MKRFALTAVILAGSIGCSNYKNPADLSGAEGRLSPAYPGPAELAYCGETRAFASSVVATGSARYRRRVVYGDYITGGLGGATLTSPHPAEERPIRQAEVRVTDGAGRVIQCGTTADDGTFAVSLPRGDAEYRITVNSRASGPLLNASVLNRPESNVPYGLSAVRNAQTTPAPIALLASADGDVLGGAFNILDMIYEANRYLRAQTAACSATFAGCRDVNLDRPLPKVAAYWERGFNPNSYFGSTSGLSFYLPGYARLFILGGEEGDVDSSDTDHFDNSVIVHEYGHFLEDKVGVSNSPGGSHNGNRVIDPRLAWSEGWGNFFQAAVRNDPHYRDTTGNDDGITALAFDVSVETGDDQSDDTSNDVPQYDGEGNYREFSVSRLLWDAVDDTPAETAYGARDTVAGKFAEIWSAFSSSVTGYPFAGYAYRNVGLLHLIQRADQARGLASDWTNLRTIERQTGDESTYAQYVEPGACAASYAGAGAAGYRFALSPGYSAMDAGTLSTSHMFLNNRFYNLKVGATGVYRIDLDWEDADHAGPKARLDLYVYGGGARFAVASDILARNVAPNLGDVTRAESKSVTVRLTPGDYLINVNVFTADGVGGPVLYNLRLGSAQLCPSNLVPR